MDFSVLDRRLSTDLPKAFPKATITPKSEAKSSLFTLAFSSSMTARELWNPLEKILKKREEKDNELPYIEIISASDTERGTELSVIARIESITGICHVCVRSAIEGASTTLTILTSSPPTSYSNGLQTF